MQFKNVMKKPIKLQCNIWYLLRGIFKVLTGYYNFDTYISENGVIIGKDVAIAPGAKIISGKHIPGNIWEYATKKEVRIGDYCWIGSNAVILPGVTLGANTVVGAGSIVTKSFPEGNCIIVGNPARKIKG